MRSSHLIAHKLSPDQSPRIQFELISFDFSHISYLKPIPRHALFIFTDQTLTVFLGVVGAGVEHAFVAGGFFVFADAAGLSIRFKCQRGLFWFREGGKMEGKFGW